MLRNKIRFILILLLAGLALTVLFYLASDRARVRTFDEHDLAMARQNMRRVTSIFWNHLDDLSKTVPDWAFWDDTFGFASSLSPGYIEDNLAEATFKNLHVDSFILLDPAGTPTYSLAFDSRTGRFSQASAALQKGLSLWEGLRRRTADDEVKTGLLVLPEGPVAFAAASILPSSVKGPSKGILVMTRNVTGEFLADVGEVAQVDLAISSEGGELKSAVTPGATVPSGADASIWVRTRDENIIEGYSELRDARGSPSVTLVALLPRPMKTLGTPRTAKLAFFLLVLMLGVACLAIVLVDRSLLSRLVFLNDQVREVKENGQLSRRLALEGDDELTNLSEKINQMLDSLQDAQDQVTNREEELREALRQKELLLKELHHRIKNNLHAVSSLFGARMPLIRDRAAAEAMRQSQHFVLSMALIHQQLHEAREGSVIDFGRYLEILSGILVQGYGRAPEVELDLEAEKVLLNADTALPVGLVANELITNSLKHAFPRGMRGRIRVRLKDLGEGTFQLDVTDNGIGPSAREGDTPFSSFGLLMVEGVIDQLGGRMIVNSGPQGFGITVTFRHYTECPVGTL